MDNNRSCSRTNSLNPEMRNPWKIYYLLFGKALKLLFYWCKITTLAGLNPFLSFVKGILLERTAENWKANRK